MTVPSAVPSDATPAGPSLTRRQAENLTCEELGYAYVTFLLNELSRPDGAEDAPALRDTVNAFFQRMDHEDHAGLYDVLVGVHDALHDVATSEARPGPH